MPPILITYRSQEHIIHFKEKYYGTHLASTWLENLKKKKRQKTMHFIKETIENRQLHPATSKMYHLYISKQIFSCFHPQWALHAQ